MSERARQKRRCAPPLLFLLPAQPSVLASDPGKVVRYLFHRLPTDRLLYSAIAFPPLHHIAGLDQIGSVSVTLPARFSSSPMPTILSDGHEDGPLLDIVLAHEAEFVIISTSQNDAARLDRDL